MKVFEKLYLTGRPEAMTKSDRLLHDILVVGARKDERLDRLIVRLNEGRAAHQAARATLTLVDKELALLDAIDARELNKAVVSRIIENLRSHHDRVDKGVLYDTSNLRFIGHYRGEEATAAAKTLLASEVKRLPAELAAYFAQAKRTSPDLQRGFHSLQRFRECLSRLKVNTSRQRDLLRGDPVLVGDLVATRLETRTCHNLLDYYLIAAVRKVIVRIKLDNARRSMPTPGPRNVFFIFGGMERRYIPLIHEIGRQLKKHYNAEISRIASFLYRCALGDLDVYFVMCIGASSRYYPPYYYIPSANDVAKFIKTHFEAPSIERVLLFGLCGSFCHGRGTVYLPTRFSRLFYTFENRVTLKDIDAIPRHFITARNFLHDIVEGERDAKIFTCSTLFNHAIVHVPPADYKRIKASVESDLTIPNRKKRSRVKGLVDGYKKRKVEAFSQHIRKGELAHGVEMESYVLAGHFPHQLGVYLEVSDNILARDAVSFDMRDFHRNVSQHMLPILMALLERPPGGPSCR